VHTYDAQATVGVPQPLPTGGALGCVEEFLSTICATTAAWPYEPATLDFHVTEGRSWRLSLSADGVRTTGQTAGGEGPEAASVRGTASDMVLWLYDRIPIESMQPHGNRRVFDLLRAWDPDE